MIVVLGWVIAPTNRHDALNEAMTACLKGY
jgi:hypothetical protein